MCPQNIGFISYILAADPIGPMCYFAYFRVSTELQGRSGLGPDPKTPLSGLRGVLHADGYAEFDGLYNGGQVREAASVFDHRVSEVMEDQMVAKALLRRRLADTVGSLELLPPAASGGRLTYRREDERFG